MKKQISTIFTVVLVFLFVGLIGTALATNFIDPLEIRTAAGTATPLLSIQNQGSSNSLEIRSTADAVVFSVGANGALTASGLLTSSVTNLVVNQPTAQATATPGVYINCTAAGANCFQIDTKGTPSVIVGANGPLTVNGAAALNGGLTMDTSAFSVADTTGDTVISGTLVVTGTSDFNNAMNVDGNVDADSFSTAGNADLVTINNSAGDITINDDTVITGTLTYGSDSLYPLGYASVDQQIVCGTDTFTGSLEITPTGLTTVTYPIAIQITDPAATAAFLTASDPTTSTFVLYSWDATYSAGSTGVSAHWCALGDQ